MVPNPVPLGFHSTLRARGASGALGKLARVGRGDRLPSHWGLCQARSLARTAPGSFCNAIIYRFITGVWSVCWDSTKCSGLFCSARQHEREPKVSSG